MSYRIGFPAPTATSRGHVKEFGANTGEKYYRCDDSWATPAGAGGLGATGPYTAGIFTQDGDVFSMDATGTELNSGVLGVDDVAVLRSAIAEIASIGRGKLFWGVGSFTIDEEIAYNIPIWMDGSGQGLTVIHPGANNITLLNLNSQAVQSPVVTPYIDLYGCKFSNITFDDTAYAASGYTFVKTCRCHSLQFTDVEFSNANGPAALTVDTSWGLYLDHVFVMPAYQQNVAGGMQILDTYGDTADHMPSHHVIFRSDFSRFDDISVYPLISLPVGMGSFFMDQCYTEGACTCVYGAPGVSDVMPPVFSNLIIGQKGCAAFDLSTALMHNIVFRPNGANTTLLKLTGGWGYQSSMLKQINATSGVAGCKIVDLSMFGDNIELDGVNTNGMSTIIYSPSGSRASKVTLSNAYIKNSDDGHIVDLTGTENATLQNVHIITPWFSVDNTYDYVKYGGIGTLKVLNCEFGAKSEEGTTYWPHFAVNSAGAVCIISNCNFAATMTAARRMSTPAVGSKVTQNIGYPTESQGSGTGTGAHTIAHGLVSTPSTVVITPTATGTTVSAVRADTTSIYFTTTGGSTWNWTASTY